MTATHDEMAKAVGLLAAAKRIVVTTGAGMSSESGIPTFRDAPGAIWANYNPEDLATPEGFQRDPDLVWRWYAERRNMIAQASPHAGHTALFRLEKIYDDFVLLTQNIDNLHRRAGSQRLIELHGNIFRFKCFDVHHAAEHVDPNATSPPRCHCGSLIRPDVVWFGEMLDAHDIDRAFAAIGACDVLIVVGTSGLVYPAAGFPDAARAAGARIVEINPERTPISALADAFLGFGAAKALPELTDAVMRRRAETH